ncbi:MAG: hypothetical protein L0154_02715 [Chloroflexi bacterium]|nr:hypothetical protein [Chloroflexota bacterium]
MHLAVKDVKRFYDIWFPLLDYVNKKHKLLPEFSKSVRNRTVSPEDAIVVRDVLWEDDSLREGFIAENPANLSTNDLALVKSWQHRVHDDFFISHYTKSYAVFMNDTAAYGVHGISDPIEVMTGGFAPIFVNTVLIPFEGRIIYDSIISGYNISFGSGYKHDIKEKYRNVQEQGGVITQLPPDPVPTISAVRQSNKKVLIAFRRELGRVGLSPQKMEEHKENMAAFSDNFLLNQPVPVFLLDVTSDLIHRYVETTGEKINWVSFKRFARFLRDTYRIDWDDAEDILKTIAQYQ